MVDAIVFVGDKCVEFVVVAVVIVVVVVVTDVVLTTLLSCALDSEVRTIESFSKHGLFISLCSPDELDFLLCFELEEWERLDVA